MIKNQENAIEEETIVIVLDPGKLENPDLDLRYDLPARPKVLELLRRERFLGNDLSQSAEIYISPGPRAELADCVRVYPV